MERLSQNVDFRERITMLEHTYKSRWYKFEHLFVENFEEKVTCKGK